jgi:hypothetical protein
MRNTRDTLVASLFLLTVYIHAIINISLKLLDLIFFIYHETKIVETKIQE